MPTGNTPPSGRAAQIAYYQALLLQQFGSAPLTGQSNSLGTDYANYMNKHPHANPESVYSKTVKAEDAFIDLTGAVPVAIGQIPDVLGKAAANLLKTNPAGDSNPLAGLSAIGNFFGNLSNPNTWKRVAEGIAGGMLLYVGIKALASNTAVGSAASSATKPVRKAARLGVSLAAPETRAKRVISKAASEKTRHTAKGLALSKKTTGTYHGAGDQAKTASKAATASKSAARTTAKTVAPKAAPRPTAAQLRAQLASRGNQLAPRVNTNGGGSIGTW
jgi:hypothetical protein